MLNLSDFLDYCRKDELLNCQIDKIYEIVVNAIIETLQQYLNSQVGTKFDCETKRLVKDFRLIQHFFLSLDKTSLEPSPLDHFPLSSRNRNETRKELLHIENAVKVKYVSLDNDTVPAKNHSKTNGKLMIVCKESDKAVITNLVIQFGLQERFCGIISEHTLIEWYQCMNTRYKISMGKPVNKALNSRFQKNFHCPVVLCHNSLS